VIYAFSSHELDEELFELRRAGERVPAQPKVLALLFFLVRERARTVTKAEILEAVWPGVFVGEASLSRAVSEARKAIGDDAQDMIVTVRARGLHFAAKVTARDAAPRSERRPLESTPPPPPAPESAGPIIGRDACLSALRARLDEATRGHAAVVWLVGEGGIGKTFVLEAFTGEAAARARVSWARSHRDEAVPAYWSWTQLARGLGERGAEAASAVTALRKRCATDEERFEGFDAVTRAILPAAGETPLVLCFDDVEHADEGSVSLLRFFAREARDARVLVLASLRDVAGIAPEAASLRALLRDRGEHLITLRSFSRADVERLAQARSEAPAPSALIDAIVEKSGGNPLFATRLLATDWAERALADAHVEVLSSLDLQAGLLESISDHLTRLSPSCVEALASAAVLGKAFSFAALAATSGMSSDALLDALAEATNAKLVTKTRGGYQFAHALVRDVLSRRVPAAERAARHKAAGHALVAAYGDAAEAHAAELAHHFLRAAPAGEAELARHYSLKAAQAALREGDAAKAATHYAGALEALDHSPSATLERLEVQLAFAAALARAGLDERAPSAFLDAATLARAFGAPAALVEATLGYAALPSADALVLPELLREAEAAAARLDGAGSDELRERVARALATQPAVQ
jgi:DNA-binding winged helix-turn-helix (wHTH) protein